jgi:Domain of unknown function (DUF4286)
MYIYNVTLKVDIAIADEWVQWMRQTHIPEVLDTGYFSNYRLSRLLDDGDLDGITFVVQYDCATIDDFLHYQSLKAPALQKDHTEKFGKQVTAFRTIMEVLE